MAAITEIRARSITRHPEGNAFNRPVILRGAIAPGVADADAARHLSSGFEIIPANNSPRDLFWNHATALQNVLEAVVATPELDTGRQTARHSEGKSIPTAAEQVPARSVRSLVKHDSPTEIRTSIPLGIWEGEIVDVDVINRMFSARLVPLRGSSVEMAGDLSFDQINAEDLPLVIPGAVFYLEQYGRTIKRQVSSEQLVRFRRLPKWTPAMVTRVAELAKALGDAFDSPRLAAFD